MELRCPRHGELVPIERDEVRLFEYDMMLYMQMYCTACETYVLSAELGQVRHYFGFTGQDIEPWPHPYRPNPDDAKGVDQKDFDEIERNFDKDEEES